MEKKAITEDMIQRLKAPLPAEAVKPHPSKTYLSSIKAIYVTERLSDVFGAGAWQTRTEVVEKGERGMIVVKVALSIPEYGVYLESYGGNDNGGEGSKNFDLGDAYKGAVTDAITKIGSWLYIGIDVFKGKQEKHKPPAQKPQAARKPLFPSKKQDEKKFMSVAAMLARGEVENKKGELVAFTIGSIEAKYTLAEDVKQALIDEAVKLQG